MGKQQEQRAVVLSIQDVAVRWKVERQAIARAIRTEQLPAFKIGHQWRVTEKTVERIEAGEEQVSI